MADINHVISLGIGSPSAVAEFITLGLQIGEETQLLPNKQFYAIPQKTEFDSFMQQVEFDA